MDKRFFLALFLSLVVIAISQWLFPTAKPVQTSTTHVDSTGKILPASSPASLVAPAAGSRVQVSPATDSAAVSVAAAAETVTVNTPKAAYSFTNIGAVPVSIVIRDYQDRSAQGGLVDLALPGLPLFGFQLVTSGDTIDLRRMPFSVTRK